MGGGATGARARARALRPSARVSGLSHPLFGRGPAGLGRARSLTSILSLSLSTHAQLLLPSFDAPLCSTCAALADFVPAADGGAALAADCRACCTPDGDAAGGGAASSPAPRARTAVLEVCDSQLRRHAHIQGFLDREAKKFGPGTVTHARRWGMPPRLLLQDEGGALLEAVRIDGWKTEHIVEYLNARLGGVEAVASAA